MHIFLVSMSSQKCVDAARTRTFVKNLSSSSVQPSKLSKKLLEFVLTCLGFAVGLGNIWRFPTRAFNNGGSAFLIPYITCALLFGLPAVYLELMVGQHAQVAPPLVYRRIAPALQGVGWMGAGVATTVAIYYIVIISWICIYLVNLTRGHVDLWTRCDNSWNKIDSCVDMINQNLCRANSTRLGIPADRVIYFRGACVDSATINTTTLISATEQYFTYNILKPSKGLFDINAFNWQLMAAMTFCWILNTLLIIKGMKIIGKVSYVSVILPYIIVLILFVRGVTLDGAATGLYYYFGNPDFGKVFSLKTWSEALKQLCFSLAVGHGGLMSMASYNKRTNNCFRDAVIIIVGDTTMSLVGGAAIFSTLGFLANQRGVTVLDVVESGLSLAFVVYPEAVSRMPLPIVWSILFFVMLFLLGISTEIALVDVFCSCLCGQSKTFKTRKWIVVLVYSISLYLIGLVFSTDAGLYWFEMFDDYSGFSSVCTAIVEVVVVVYVYGAANFSNDIRETLGEPRAMLAAWLGGTSPYFVWNWRLITPTIGLVLLGLSAIRQYPFMNNPDKYPIFFDIGGWSLQLFVPFIIPIFGIASFLQFKRRGYDTRGLWMIQKQHKSYQRIYEGMSDEQKKLQAILPDYEPWNEPDATESENVEISIGNNDQLVPSLLT
ncbi:unnamed protein product [Caenorhabditis bovis]|uniref:Uncharacterized protein n=1 Tax=Caenorhabditis bovis TaxID=2654633 RepID=A0A8S1FEF3_9PELO|nr:unnamed protein product [Caenorhabditis bovis]